MALDFPANPTNGQYYNGFVYNAANSSWDSAYAPRAATIPISAPNPVINGGMDIWQRGTASTVINGGGYLADRWVSITNSNTLSQDTDVPVGFNYSLKSVSSLVNAVGTKIESANMIYFAGKTVTLSFWYKRTSGTGNLSLRVYYANAKDNFSANTSVSETVISATPSSSWTRYTKTFDLPAAAVNGLYFWVENELASTSFMTGVQIDVGTAATDFRRNAPSIQAEFAACQRYYAKSYSLDAVPSSNDPRGRLFLDNTSTVSRDIRASVYWPVQMRATPTITIYGAGGGAPNPVVYSDNPGTAGTLFYSPSLPTGQIAQVQWVASAEI